MTDSFVRKQKISVEGEKKKVSVGGKGKTEAKM